MNKISQEINPLFQAGLREFSYQEMVPSLEGKAEQVAEADR